MDGKVHSPISAPKVVLSVEITPAEYEYYMQKAQQMRAESMAATLRALFAPVRRLFARANAPALAARARPTADRHEPVLMKQRTA